MLITQCYQRALKTVIVLSLCVFSFGLNAEVDLLGFPKLGIHHSSGSSFSERNLTPSIDVFATGRLGPVLILAEAFASESVQHVERLQFGMKISDSSQVWLGRHHNPFGYWHTEYHHGTYLQTSISRPAMAELGGAGGIIPSHSTGGLFEGTLEQGMSAWHYTLSIGYTSQLNSTGGGHHGGGARASLHDLDILDPKTNDHELGYTFKLAYLPDALGQNQFGGFISHANITQADQHHASNNNSISLDIAGVFANYQREKLRLVAEAYFLSSDIPDHHDTLRGSFSTAYIQAEYTLNDQWTPYTRLSESFGGGHDPYLELLDGFPHAAQMAGIRFDITEQQALKLEYSHRQFEHENANRWQLSWSAVWQ